MSLKNKDSNTINVPKTLRPWRVYYLLLIIYASMVVMGYYFPYIKGGDHAEVLSRVMAIFMAGTGLIIVVIIVAKQGYHLKVTNYELVYKHLFKHAKEVTYSEIHEILIVKKHGQGIDSKVPMMVLVLKINISDSVEIDVPKLSKKVQRNLICFLSMKAPNAPLNYFAKEIKDGYFKTYEKEMTKELIVIALGAAALIIFKFFLRGHF